MTTVRLPVLVLVTTFYTPCTVLGSSCLRLVPPTVIRRYVHYPKAYPVTAVYYSAPVVGYRRLVTVPTRRWFVQFYAVLDLTVRGTTCRLFRYTGHSSHTYYAGCGHAHAARLFTRLPRLRYLRARTTVYTCRLRLPTLVLDYHTSYAYVCSFAVAARTVYTCLHTRLRLPDGLPHGGPFYYRHRLAVPFPRGSLSPVGYCLHPAAPLQQHQPAPTFTLAPLSYYRTVLPTARLLPVTGYVGSTYAHRLRLHICHLVMAYRTRTTYLRLPVRLVTHGYYLLYGTALVVTRLPHHTTTLRFGAAHAHGYVAGWILPTFCATLLPDSHFATPRLVGC